MNYLNFLKHTKNLPSFSLRDMQKAGEVVYPHRLADWQKKGYIKRIANGVYIPGDTVLNEMWLYYLANRIYTPSYVSLETALSYYGFIPEAVFSVTSISTRKTQRFSSDNTEFSYRTVKPALFFGYTLIPWNNTAIRFATPEKALIDFLYINPHLNSEEAIDELRLNAETILERINRTEINHYLAYINNKKLTQRMSILLKAAENA